MKHRTVISSSLQISGSQAALSLVFLACLFFANLSHAIIPFPELDGDSTKHYSSKSKTKVVSNGSRWTSRRNFSSIDIQHRGEISVNDADTDVTAISPGGFLKIKKTTFGNTRSILIESNSRGELTKEYYEGRKQVPFEGEGRKWLADILLDVVRQTGIASEARTSRFYKQGGVNAVLGEIRQIHSSSGKGRYFEALLGICSQNDLPEIAQKIGYYISSNSIRGELFRGYSDRFLANSTSAQAFFEGVAYMTSNTERGRILRQVLRSNKLDEKGMVGLLRVARRMTSNTERGTVLREVNNQFPKSEEAIEAYFDVIDGMTSNTEKGSILRNLIREQPSSTQVTQMVLEATGHSFTSNTEMGSVLRAVVPKISGDDTKSIELYLKAVRRMTSNTETGSALVNLLGSVEIKSNEVKIELFQCVRRMTSNTERGRVLRTTIDFLGKDNLVDDAFFSALGTMTSNTEKGYVLRTVISKLTMTKAMSIRILEATRHFTSNTEIGSIMTSLSRVMPKNDEQVKEAYRHAARRLSSNTEYRRVMEAID